jgi:rRNA 2'-O-methyltransferase fibrillarin
MLVGMVDCIFSDVA